MEISRRDAGGNSMLLGLQDSASYTRELFAQLWQQQGGTFGGEVIIGRAPAKLTPIKVYHSPPLAEIIRGINKFSNNIAARQLYLTLGTEGSTRQSHSPATLEKSEQMLNRWLASKQLFFPELVVENGSGLSRIELHQCAAYGRVATCRVQQFGDARADCIDADCSGRRHHEKPHA